MRKKQLVKGVEYIRIAPTKNGDYSYTDDTVCFDGIMRGVKSSLYKWRGQLVKRIRPAGCCISFMDRPVKLISATRYHVVAVDPESDYQYILNIRYANPDDWELFNPK